MSKIKIAKNKQINALFEALSQYFLRGFFLGLLLLLAWFWLYVMLGGWCYEVHEQWFGITRVEFDRVNYYGMAAMKLFIIVAFFIPYLSTKMMQKGSLSG